MSIKILWSTVSNAFRRSKNKTPFIIRFFIRFNLNYFHLSATNLKPVDRSQIRCELSLDEKMYLDMFGETSHMQSE